MALGWGTLTLNTGSFPQMPINLLLIKCAVSLKTALNAPDKDFEDFETVGSDNYLKLWIERANYKENKTYKDGSNQYVRSFTAPIVKLKVYAREIEIKVVDERVILYELIQLIARTSISTDLQTQTSVQIIDFVLPETQDRINAITSALSRSPTVTDYSRTSSPMVGL